MAHYDFFIASRWANRETVLDLTARLRVRGQRVYCFIEGPDGALRDYDPDFEKLPLEDAWVRAEFARDVEALRASRALILLLPAGKSSHIEAGIAFGLGKDCILIGDPGPTQGLYLIFGARCATVDDFLKAWRTV